VKKKQNSLIQLMKRCLRIAIDIFQVIYVNVKYAFIIKAIDFKDRDHMSKIIYPPCKKCEASHRMGIENMETGEIEPIDLCKNCLWFGTFHPINYQITFEEMVNGNE